MDVEKRLITNQSYPTNQSYSNALRLYLCIHYLLHELDLRISYVQCTIVKVTKEN